MNTFIWLLLALIMVLAVGVFLWPSLRRQKAKKTGTETLPRPQFMEEIAEELSLTVPVAPENQVQHLPEPQLPHSYGVDRLTLMARDPHWLYAYWEITATKQDEFVRNYGPEAWSSTHPVLRVYDVTGVDFNGSNAKGFLDITLSDDIESWNIEVREPDRSFCVDLGRMFQDGRFITLLRSNVANTPRASLSDRPDEEWMWIEGLYRTLGKFQYGVSSPMLTEELSLKAGKLPLEISSPGNWHPGSEK
ncbi:MAG: DUF4912 domain-containing protein [Desulfotomaculaceae bacterium]|nr:DUF4912 domain-containing protein [Desulfotomaculaceae bacterium]